MEQNANRDTEIKLLFNYFTLNFNILLENCLMGVKQ